MKKIKILFMIPSLAEGGAEKVLVNLVNNMNRERFDITLQVLFDGGVNKQFLKPWIKYKACMTHAFRGNTYILKLFSPKRLYDFFICGKYDILISYLEGPTARIVSGCKDKNTKLISWIHSEQYNLKTLAKSFRNEKESIRCYNRFDQTVCVSQAIKEDFCKILRYRKPCNVLYNTIESDKILKLANESATELKNDGKVKLIAVGTLKKIKGYERLLRIANRLIRNKYPIHLYILGKGPLKNVLQSYIEENDLMDSITLLGYNTNPYKIVSKCDLFVCSSFSEGFSTATMEALIVGTAVCTVEVPGMKEMLGECEYGLIVENSEEALYEGIKRLVEDSKLREQYIRKAKERAKDFRKESTVAAVEKLFMELIED